MNCPALAKGETLAMGEPVPTVEANFVFFCISKKHFYSVLDFTVFSLVKLIPRCSG